MIDDTINTDTEYTKNNSPKLQELNISEENSIITIKRANCNVRRKILFVNNYGMAQAFRLWKDGLYPSNHLWGCIELAIMGYEVILPEPATSSGILRRFQNDWSSAWFAVSQLKADDIVYCGHNILLWTPLLKALKAVKCKIVGLLFAREPLPMNQMYDGIIAHTPVAKEHVQGLKTKAKCEHISWGMDLDFFSSFPYNPRWFLSCGKTFRDFGIISNGFQNTDAQANVIHPYPDQLISMPKNVKVLSAKKYGEGIYCPLVDHYYRYAYATLLTLVTDRTQRHSVGLTNLFESMACGRPVIVTKTSALTSEIDVEKQGIGLFVPPNNVETFHCAVEAIYRDKAMAEEMGKRGRKLCEDYFNIERFAKDLHIFFESI